MDLHNLPAKKPCPQEGELTDEEIVKNQEVVEAIHEVVEVVHEVVKVEVIEASHQTVKVGHGREAHSMVDANLEGSQAVSDIERLRDVGKLTQEVVPALGFVEKLTQEVVKAGHEVVGVEVAEVSHEVAKVGHEVVGVEVVVVSHEVAKVGHDKVLKVVHPNVDGVQKVGDVQVLGDVEKVTQCVVVLVVATLVKKKELWGVEDKVEPARLEVKVFADRRAPEVVGGRGSPTGRWQQVRV